MVERVLSMHEVSGSIPEFSTANIFGLLESEPCGLAIRLCEMLLPQCGTCYFAISLGNKRNVSEEVT